VLVDHRGALTQQNNKLVSVFGLRITAQYVLGFAPHLKKYNKEAKPISIFDFGIVSIIIDKFLLTPFQ
jgi:hypothetical protein